MALERHNVQKYAAAYDWRSRNAKKAVSFHRSHHTGKTRHAVPLSCCFDRSRHGPRFRRARECPIHRGKGTDADGRRDEEIELQLLRPWRFGRHAEPREL